MEVRPPSPPPQGAEPFTFNLFESNEAIMEDTATSPDPTLCEAFEESADPALSEVLTGEPPVTLGNLRFPHAAQAITDLQLLTEQVKQLTAVTDKEVREEAVRRLIKVSTFRKRREKEMAEAVKPLLAQEINLRKPYQLDIGNCKALETDLTLKIQSWDRAELAKAREVQAKRNQLIEEQNKKALDKAEEKGLPAPMLKAPEVVQVSDAKVKTEDGSANRKIVKNWSLHHCNLQAKDEKELKKLIGQIPANDPRVKEVDRAHLLLNVKLIDQLVELGQDVPGVSIFDDVSLKTRRSS